MGGHLCFLRPLGHITTTVTRASSRTTCRQESWTPGVTGPVPTEAPGRSYLLVFSRGARSPWLVAPPWSSDPAAWPPLSLTSVPPPPLTLTLLPPSYRDPVMMWGPPDHPGYLLPPVIRPFPWSHLRGHCCPDRSHITDCTAWTARGSIVQPPRLDGHTCLQD